MQTDTLCMVPCTPALIQCSICQQLAPPFFFCVLDAILQAFPQLESNQSFSSISSGFLKCLCEQFPLPSLSTGRVPDPISICTPMHMDEPQLFLSPCCKHVLLTGSSGVRCGQSAPCPQHPAPGLALGSCSEVFLIRLSYLLTQCAHPSTPNFRNIC